MGSPPYPDKKSIYFVGRECTFGQSWKEWYPARWRSTISRYAVARTPIHASYYSELLPIHVSLILSSFNAFLQRCL